MTLAIRGQHGATWARGYPVGRGLRFSVVVAPAMGRAITAMARDEGISTAEMVRRLLEKAMSE